MGAFFIGSPSMNGVLGDRKIGAGLQNFSTHPI
jgi:hypothetical protein